MAILCSSATSRLRSQRFGTLVVAAATISLFWIVPEFPLAHLDDPSHWGVIGYAATVVVITARATGRLATTTEGRWMVGFLAGMPLVYVANWVRFGGSAAWLSVEVLGLIGFGTLAWRSRRRPWLLSVGIASHALWDAVHWGRTDFVPHWYIIGCVLVDVAIGTYIWLCQRLPPKAASRGTESKAEIQP